MWMYPVCVEGDSRMVKLKSVSLGVVSVDRSKCATRGKANLQVQ